MSGDYPSNSVWFSFCFPPRCFRRQERHMFKYAECLPSLCLRACGVRHPGRRPGDGRPPHTDGHRTRHPMRFWVVRTYKISSYRSAGTEHIINLLIAERLSNLCLPAPKIDPPIPRHPGHRVMAGFYLASVLHVHPEHRRSAIGRRDEGHDPAVLVQPLRRRP